MASTVTISTIAGLILVGTGAGVHLGRSAVSEINPLYFQPKPVASYATMTPYRSPPGSAPVTQFAALETDGDLGTGCIGCRTYPEEYLPRHDGTADGYAASAWQPEEPSASASAYAKAPEAAEAAVDPRTAEWEQVVRYAGYPIEEEQVEEAPVEAEQAVQLEQ